MSTTAPAHMIPMPTDPALRADVRRWIAEASVAFHRSRCHGQACDESGYCDRHNRETKVLARLVRARLSRKKGAR